MKYLMLIGAIITLTINLSVAQIQNITTNISGEPLRLKSYKDIIGTPYLYEEWQMGTFIAKNGNLAETVLMRYNSYEDKVEFKKNGEFFTMPSDLIQGFTLSIVDMEGKIKRYTFVNGFKVGELNEKNFFATIYNKKLKFLHRLNTKLVETTATYGTSVQQSKFVKNEEFYLVKETGESFKIKRTNSALLKILDRVELKDFIKKNNLNIKNDNDLIQILDFYETTYLK